MKLLGKVLVLLLIGCSFTQNFIEPLEPVDIQKFHIDPIDTIDRGFGNSSTGVIGVLLNASEYGKSIKSFYQYISSSLIDMCRDPRYPGLRLKIFAIHKEVFNEADTCINSILYDVELTEREFYRAVSIGSLQTFLKKLCKAWPTIYDCIKPVVSYYKRCLTRDQKLSVDEGLAFLNEENIFFCGNNTHRLLKLVNIESTQCFTLVSKDLQKCQTTIVNKLVQLTKQSRNAMGSMTFEEEYEFCSALHDQRKCTSSILATCNSTDPSNIMDDYMALIQHIFCSSASRLSWFGFVNLLLFVGIYLYSKMF
ncbi:uncharacterized protein LOC114338491 [Diabrotica virgifera virgifera]|uniref:Uncharacterized protein LOC114338491 n=1 Tax=Diabrotica virgifera virgifera TaxID=50390 RepID=A0A6P7GM81_DIAVI|nr:uncharacterized protein LOC114338491 [Diabrotica virgifera virgifera]